MESEDISGKSLASGSTDTASETSESQEDPSDFRRTESLAQLTTNAVAPYVPDILKSNNKYSGKTYPCNSCGDTYLCESSLSDHLKRKSVLIHFNCNSCNEMKIFYNRCCLLSHISSHVVLGQSSNISNAILYPIPLVIMTGMPDDVMKTLLDEINDRVEDVEFQSPSKLVEVSLSEIEENVETHHNDKMLKNSLPTSIESIVNHNKNGKTTFISCSECKEMFFSFSDRVRHFINDNKLPNPDNSCPSCQKNLPSKCAMRAHKRLHQQVSPYICPECGDNPDRFWEGFQKHLKYECCHLSRVVGYKCRMCGTFIQNAFNFLRHSFAKHMLIYLKCKVCPMAFKNSKNYQIHKVKYHGSHSTSEPGYYTIYSCARKDCGQSFIDHEGALNHMNTHLPESFYGYLFKCMECELPFDSKDILHKHIQLHHSKVYLQYIKKNVAQEEINDPIQPFNNQKIECLLCHCAFSSSSDYGVHVQRSHSYGKQPCLVCGATLKLRAEKIMHTKQHLRQNVPICLICYKKPNPPETLDSHLLCHVSEIKYQTLCVICCKTLLNSKEAYLHLKSEHYLRKVSNVIPDMNMNTSENKNKESAKPVSKKVAQTNGAINNLSPLPTTLFPIVKPKNKQKTISEPKPKKTYETGHCFKCEFISTDRNEFKEHIISHKLSTSSFQCMDCGECYSVENSLRLHLLANHNITDVDKYIATEGTNHIPEKEIIPETPKTNDLECSVCFEIFTSDTLLKTHLRSHGMAFIQANKRSNAFL